jgi:hypothetical protein
MQANATSWTTPVHSVKYHMQDKPETYCGPAALMMVLQYAESQNAGVQPAPLVGQDTSYPWMHHAQGNTPWDTSPDGLALGLNHFKSPHVAAKFRVQQASSPLALAQRVVAALAHKEGLPPAVLSDACNHWVVVSSAVLDKDPTRDGAYVLAFKVNDPSATWQGDGIPPHEFGDACGAGPQPDGYYGDSEAVWCWAWWTERLRPCSLAPLNNAFAGVFSDRHAEIGKLVAPPPGLWGSAPEGDGLDLLRVLDPDLAGETAIRAVRRIFAADAPDRLTAGSSSLVRRLEPDRRGRSYYITPVFHGEAFWAAVAVDASSGEPLCLTRNRGYLPLPEPSEVEEALAYAQARGAHAFAEELVRGRFTVSTPLVWRPCRESTTPFQPFQRITADGRTLYRDVRGRVHSRLTPRHHRAG